jgi:hypothetical protein
MSVMFQMLIAMILTYSAGTPTGIDINNIKHQVGNNGLN